MRLQLAPIFTVDCLPHAQALNGFSTIIHITPIHINTSSHTTINEISSTLFTPTTIFQHPIHHPFKSSNHSTTTYFYSSFPFSLHFTSPSPSTIIQNCKHQQAQPTVFHDSRCLFKASRTPSLWSSCPADSWAPAASDSELLWTKINASMEGATNARCFACTGSVAPSVELTLYKQNTEHLLPPPCWHLSSPWHFQ